MVYAGVLYLEAVGSIWGVLWGFSCVELCVAAKENTLQFTTDGRTITATVVFHCWQHAGTLRISGTIRGAVHSTQRVKTHLQQTDHGHQVQSLQQDTHTPGPLEVVPLLVSVEDGERQHPAGDHLGFLQQLVQMDGGVICGHVSHVTAGIHSDLNVTLQSNLLTVSCLWTVVVVDNQITLGE